MVSDLCDPRKLSVILILIPWLIEEINRYGIGVMLPKLQERVSHLSLVKSTHDSYGSFLKLSKLSTREMFGYTS